MAKDWRVRYGSYDGDGDNHTRSKPFDSEEQALAWAITWVKGQDPAISPMADVAHRQDGELDPTPRTHRITWLSVDGELRLIKRTWPSQSLADHEAEMRRVIGSLGEPNGPRVYTEYEIVDEMPLRAL